MNKRVRQYAGLLSAVLAYYAVHEVAHLIYAFCTGIFRQINFMGIGMQIDLAEKDTQFYTCHCTGEKVFQYMKRQTPNLNYLSCGESIHI